MCCLPRPIRLTTKILVLALLGFQIVSPAMAYESIEAFTFRTPVTKEVLDSMRGGFQRDPDGPFMTFGIERNVFNNGKLVSSTVLNIPDMERFADRNWNPFADHSETKSSVDRTGMRPAVHPRSDTFTLIQSRPDNSLPHEVSALPPFTTIIQNSLDNRTLQSETVINATVEALTWARSLNLGSALSQANMEAIRH